MKATEWIQLRVTKERKDRYASQASQAGQSLTGWVIAKCEGQVEGGGLDVAAVIQALNAAYDDHKAKLNSPPPPTPRAMIDWCIKVIENMY